MSARHVSGQLRL